MGILIDIKTSALIADVFYAKDKSATYSLFAES
ncbi:hypothetical protein VAA_01476 [Vibrio anguillarum 775]|nr:hypothetical protein VAA_01476 [Vibrio anguillarum 775]